MAALPKKPTQMKKDDVMKDDLFGEELSLAEDVAPEGAIDDALETERMGAEAPVTAEEGSLTPEEQDVLAQAEEIKASKKKAYDEFMKGSVRAASVDEEMAEGEVPAESENSPEESPLKKMKPGQNFY